MALAGKLAGRQGRLVRSRKPGHHHLAAQRPDNLGDRPKPWVAAPGQCLVQAGPRHPCLFRHGRMADKL